MQHLVDDQRLPLLLLPGVVRPTEDTRSVSKEHRTHSKIERYINNWGC